MKKLTPRPRRAPAVGRRRDAPPCRRTSPNTAKPSRSSPPPRGRGARASGCASCSTSSGTSRCTPPRSTPPTWATPASTTAGATVAGVDRLRPPSRPGDPGRPGVDRPLAAQPRRAGQLRPGGPSRRGVDRRGEVPRRVPADQPAGGAAAGSRPAPLDHAGAQREGLREHHRPHARRAQGHRPVDRAARPRAQGGDHAAEGDPARRPRPGREPARRRSHEEPDAQDLPEVPRHRLRRRPRAPDARGDPGVQGAGGAGLPQAARLPRQHLPAGRPRVDRHGRPAERQGLVRLRGAQLHDDHSDPRADPPDRPRRGQAHPRGDGRPDRHDRLQGELRGLLHLPAHRSPLLLRQARGPARRLPRHRQADRSRADPAVRQPAAPPLRRHPGALLLGEVADHRLLRGGVARRRPAGRVQRQHLRPEVAAEVGDGGAHLARGGPRPSPPALARPGAGGGPGVAQARRLHRLRRGVGALLREPGGRDRALQGPLLQVRPAHLRDLAGDPPGGRHRHAHHGVDAPAGDRLFQGQLRQDRPRHRGRDRPLHRLAGAGAGLQDRRAEDQGAARLLARRSWGTKFDIRAFHDHVLGNGAVPLDLLEKNIKAWVAETKAGAPAKAAR